MKLNPYDSDPGLERLLDEALAVEGVPQDLAARIVDQMHDRPPWQRSIAGRIVQRHACWMAAMAAVLLLAMGTAMRVSIQPGSIADEQAAQIARSAGPETEPIEEELQMLWNQLDALQSAGNWDSSSQPFDSDLAEWEAAINGIGTAEF